jgi:hypothetical protein
MLPLVLVGLFLDVGPVCLTVGKTKACGYQCVREGKTALCTQTPAGFCATQGSRGACFDPAPDVSWLLANDDTIERPQCMVSLKEVACGFHCLKMVDGRVRCAQTPEGVCHANQEAIQCWDPAEAVRWRMLQSRHVENAQCVSLLDHIECGYHCLSVGSSMACAASPWGACDSHFTDVACADPSFAGVQPIPPPSWCKAQN